LPNPNFKNQEFLAKKSRVDKEIFTEKSGENQEMFFRNQRAI
jgi:hypothetical protein